jgi:chaperonin GroES
MKIKPFGDRVLVKRIEEEARTPSGIIIPDQFKEKPVYGEVVSVGSGTHDSNGNLRPLKVKEGDQVIFGKYAGFEVDIEGESYLIMREDDLLADIER